MVKTGRLNFSDCLRLLRTSKVADGTVLNVDSLDNIINLIKPRCKADLAVRRITLKDIAHECEDTVRWLTHLDLITATNLCVWAKIWGNDVFMKVKSTGMFNSIASLIEMGGEVSSYVKRFPADDGSKQMFAEISTLTGYLQNDIHEVSWQEELKALAHGGAPHGLIGENIIDTFKRNLSSWCPMRSRKPFITMRDYIDSGRWITSGSSSIGKVEWRQDEKHGHFKARKNMVQFLYTTDELLDLVNKWNGKLKSRAFTKDELSKRRLAVACNIESYLCEAWTLEIMGHFYKAWDFLTLDESPVQQHTRTIKVASQLRGGDWALPFDFKAFDHQPTTNEIETLLSHNLGGVSLPVENRAEWIKYVSKIKSSYRHNTITLSKDGQTHKEMMSGGLPSGVRFTSLVGNQWNMMMTLRAREIVNSISGQENKFTIGIKGDDTYIISDRASVLYLYRLAYESINAVGIDAKFGITQGVCEFLRVEIGGTYARGWTNRSIPTITQRKPWASESADLTTAVTTVASCIHTLERRLLRDMEWLHNINRVKWSRFTKQSPRWLELPREYGGIGVYPWRGWKSNIPWPQPATDKTWTITSDLVGKQLEWITLSESEQIKYSLVSMHDTISEDNIPGAQRNKLDNALADIRRTRVLWHKEDVSWQPKFWIKTWNIPTDENSAWPSPTQWFDDTSLAMSIIREYSVVRRIREDIPTLGAVLADSVPGFYSRMKNAESLGWHRTNAIQIASGDIPTSYTGKLHPQLTVFVKASLELGGVRYWRGRNNILRRLYIGSRDISKEYCQSPGNSYYNY